MSLRKEQSFFVRDILKLLLWAEDSGYECTFGEAQRTVEQQKIYVQTGRSKTMDSYHIKKLAMDIFFFKNGILLQTKEELQEIGNTWENLSSSNSWGGNWNSFKDTPHFERRV